MSNTQLEHSLKNRHIQMIAIGGAIGTGFFLASAGAIAMTGPSIVLAYLFGGVIIYGIMLALGEMTVDYPNSGSFIEYAHRYLGAGAGFIAGWNAWLLFTCACMLEVTAVGSLLDYWFFLPHWVICLVLLTSFTSLNLINIKYFGETEFWFAIIKVLVIIFMIVTGIYLICANNTIHAISVNNLIQYQRPQILFSHGYKGFLNALVIVCLSFCGTEFISVAAGEAKNPRKSIPKAINGVVLRIVLFYVLTLAVIMLIYPFEQINPKINPFADVFAKIGMKNAAAVINAVAITAAVSSLNSCLYVASRFLHRLAVNKQAPKMFAALQHSLPRNAILFTSAIAFVIVLVNYLEPQQVLRFLIALITVAIIINWYIILLSHMFFRRQIAVSGKKLHFRMYGYPIVNIAIMLVLFILLVVMSQNSQIALSVYIAPAWILLLSIIYALSNFSKMTLRKIKNHNS